MASFELGAFNDFDYGLLQNSPVSLFRSRSVLDAARAQLSELGYQVVTVDAAQWRGSAEMHRDLADALDFPEHYGENFNALDDCLSDVATYEYGSRADATGLTLIVQGFEAFAERQPDDAHQFADCFARAARTGLLFGHRMLLLLHVDSAGFQLPRVGALVATWNPAEWLDSARS